MSNEINQKINVLKDQYKANQRRRSRPNLKISERHEILKKQNAIIAKIKHLESLLVQRFKFN